MPDTKVKHRRPRTDCPTCGREVAFWTDLANKYLTRHKTPDGRHCGTRSVPVPA